MWPSPSPLNPSWYYWSLLTGCLRMVTLCHNTVAKSWISLSICHKTIFKCRAGDSLNKYYIRIFVKERPSVKFSSERKCCGVDQMFLKDVANVPTRSQSILFKLENIRQELTVESETGGVRGMPPGKFWNLGPLNGWKCVKNFAKLMFSVSKSMTLPWLSKI